MHESHPGVQDMACDTFLKIVRQCAQQFFVKEHPFDDHFVEGRESMSFIEEVLRCEASPTDLLAIPKFQIVMRDLDLQQQLRFYEALALMIKVIPDHSISSQLLSKLMKPTNDYWDQIVRRIEDKKATMGDCVTCRQVNELLQTNVAVCTSLGVKFLPQLDRIYTSMLMIYQAYSETIQRTLTELSSKGITEQHTFRSSVIRQMRHTKKTVLLLFETFVRNCELNDRLGLLPFAGPIITPLLLDYQTAIPDGARESDILSCLTVLIDKLGDMFHPFVGTVLQSTFEVTLKMITRNMEEYPEHRIKFFGMVRAITNTCFHVLFEMSSEQLQLVVDSIIWAVRHTERNVADVGLKLLFEMLQRFEKKLQDSTKFYRNYYRTLVHEVFAVLTDTFHKSGFKLHVRILHHLFHLVQDTGPIKILLWEKDSVTYGAAPSASNNKEHVKGYLMDLLTRSFPNLQQLQIHAVVEGLFCLHDVGAFEQHVRDFLVQIRGFTDEHNATIFAAEFENNQTNQ
jgi:exportin-1